MNNPLVNVNKTGLSLTSVIASIILFSFVFGGLLVVIISTLAACVVPFTWLYSKIVGLSYAHVCDSSEMVYQLNKIGRWTLVIYLGCMLVCTLHRII